MIKRGWRTYTAMLLSLILFGFLSYSYLQILKDDPAKINENVFAFIAGGITAIVGVFFAQNAAKSISYNKNKKDEPNN